VLRSAFRSILAGRDLQVPRLEERLWPVLRNALTPIRLELHLPVMTDVGEMGDHGAHATLGSRAASV